MIWPDRIIDLGPFDKGARTPCGTTHCLAGHALAEIGETFIWSNADWIGPPTAETTIAGHSIGAAAQEALGLTLHQRLDLFHADNTLDNLWSLAEEFTNGEIQAPA